MMLIFRRISTFINKKIVNFPCDINDYLDYNSQNKSTFAPNLKSMAFSAM